MAGASRTHTFVTGQPRRSAVTGKKTVERGGYQVLFRVIYRHSFYDSDKGLCRDLRALPTPTTAEFMQSHGLVFQDNGIGFTVYAPAQKIPSLVYYLHGQGRPPLAGEQGTVYWNWLSFVLIPVNPIFVGITALPIDTNPALVNAFLTNQSAHWSDPQKTQKSRLLLAPNGTVDTSDLRQVTDAQFPLEVNSWDDRIVIRDISGAVVMKVPSDQAKDDEEETARRDPPTTGPYYRQVDLTTLPFGLYRFTVERTPPEAKTAREKGAPKLQLAADIKLNPPPIRLLSDQGLLTLLYTAAKPGMPLCFLDILFSCPYRGAEGVYPLPPLWLYDPDNPKTYPWKEIGNLEYELDFEARKTFWQYYVVSQSPGSELRDLHITGHGTSFKKAPNDAVLPNGDKAVLFNAQSVLPLRDISLQRFSLHGVRKSADGAKSKINVACLPVAPQAPVWPVRMLRQDEIKVSEEEAQINGLSEMFVYV